VKIIISACGFPQGNTCDASKTMERQGQTLCIRADIHNMFEGVSMAHFGLLKRSK